MKSRILLPLGLCALIALLATPARAQADESGRYSLGLAGGMVDTNFGTTPYWTANLRIRSGYRPAGEEKKGAVTGFFEPEIGYWSRSENGVQEKDTLIGLNLGGAVRLQAIEYFLGGGIGYHFLNRDIQGIGSKDKGQVGANAQFGVDVLVSDTVSIFGVGRFDLVQSDSDTIVLANGDRVQPKSTYAKAYLGVRFHF
jgi:hypothetical protein